MKQQKHSAEHIKAAAANKKEAAAEGDAAAAAAAAAEKAAQAKLTALLERLPKSVDLSLERIARLLAALGNPHLRLPPVIHIAGTNGKGSAAAFARAFLEAAGNSVHVHTSPHLVHWRERFRLGSKQNGKPRSAFVADAVLAPLLAEVSAANNGRPITIFELLTAAAFVLFARFPADALVLEVGLGGRFDATNIIPRPACALIMPIGLDHQAFLGDSAAAIAAEKAGIIKPHCPLVLGCQPIKEAQAALTAAAKQKQAQPISLYGADYRAEPAADGKSWLFKSGKTHKAAAAGRAAPEKAAGEPQEQTLRLPLPRLAGAFQLGNAAAALRAVQAAGFSVSAAAAAEAMRTVYWPGRCEKLRGGALAQFAPQNAEIWLDGGHNPAAAAVLAQALRPLLRPRQTSGAKPLYLISALLQNKDAENYLRALKALRPKLYAVPLCSSDQGLPPEKLQAAAAKLGITAQTAAGIKQALRQITAETAGKTAEAPLILICGSLYLIGDALAQNGTPPA